MNDILGDAMNPHDQMQDYYDLCQRTRKTGTRKGDRTGTGTISVFGAQMRFDLRRGFPMVTRKFVPFRLVKTELDWFLMGNPNIDYLHDHNNHIWDEWVKEDGTFGPIYGQQWRSWPTYRPTGEFRPLIGALHHTSYEIDQIQRVIDDLNENPDSRRIIVSAWNVAAVDSGEMALPPCHILFQFYSRPLDASERVRWMRDHRGVSFGGEHPDEDSLHATLDRFDVPRRGLSCQLYQRSADLFLGVPFNIASYALLTHMIAHLTDHVPEEFIWTGGDCHIYENHQEQVQKMLEQQDHPAPQLTIHPDMTFHRIEDFFDPEAITLKDYSHGPKISAPVAV